jgi:hypothetical protein
LALRIALPDGADPVDVVGSVAHRVTTGDSIRTGAQAGMGIGFFALSGEAKTRWDSFVELLVTQAGGQVQLPVVRSSNRPTFLLRLRDLNRLQEFRERELRLGSMFLKTPVLRAVGDVVQLIIIHPITDEEFGLTASVTATSQGSPTEPKGMSLKISPLDGERDVAFDAFLAGEEPLPQPLVEPPLPAADEPIEELVNPFAGGEVTGEALTPRPPAGPPPPLRSAPWAVQSPPPTVDPHAELRRTVDRDPDALGPRLRLGAALAQSPGTAAEAIALLNSVLEREPQHPLAHGSIALAHAQLGETSEAERHLTRALRLGHVDPELERRVRGASSPA